MGWFTKDTDYPPNHGETMGCPDCSGRGCGTCGGDGTVPAWLKNPDVTGEEAARSWGWLG
jgi:hypothetical protein